MNTPLALHVAAGKQAARRIIAHPEQHGPQRIAIAWCALNGVRRMPPVTIPKPRADWWREAVVIEAGAASWALNDDGAFDFGPEDAA